jgi:hypothetical protein
MYAAKVWDLALVQGPFSPPHVPCQTIALRFATFSTLVQGGRWLCRGPACLPTRLEPTERAALAKKLVSYAQTVWGSQWAAMDDNRATQNGKCPLTERQTIELLVVSSSPHDRTAHEAALASCGCIVHAFCDEKVANRNIRDIAHAITRPFRDARRFPPHDCRPHAHVHTYAANVWDSSIVEAPFSARAKNPYLAIRCASRLVARSVDADARRAAPPGAGFVVQHDHLHRQREAARGVQARQRGVRHHAGTVPGLAVPQGAPMNRMLALSAASPAPKWRCESCESDQMGIHPVGGGRTHAARHQARPADFSGAQAAGR